MTTRKVKDVVNLINGYSFSTEDWSDHGYKIVRIQNLNDSSAKYNRTQKTVGDKYYINLGDILISWAATLGIYEWNDERAILNQHIYKVEFISDEILKDYFKYVINIAINELTYKMRGGGIKHLTKGMLDEYEFILPDIEVQSRIVSKLNIVQELIKQRQKSIELLDEYLKATFLEMFGDPLSDVKNFKTVKLANPYFSLSSGTTPSRNNLKYYEKGTIPWVKSTDLNSDIINTTEESITEDAINETSLKIYPKGSVLLAMYGQGKTRGKVSLLNIDATCNQACAVIQSDRFSNIFLYSFLNYSYDYLRSLSRGGNRQNLSLELLRGVDIINPSVDDQLIYESIFNKLVKNKLNYNQSLFLLKELFNSLQYNLFNQKEKRDEIDLFIDDEFKVDELLKSIISFTDKTEQQYNLEKDLLFRILERTEKNNKEDKEYLKGIVLKFEEDIINILTNKEEKFSRS